MSYDIREQSLAQKRRQIESNPCHTEQIHSYKCLEINSNDSDKCLREFENFKMCKTFWYEIQKFRQINRIYPPLPESQERQQMKDIYMKTGSIKPIIEDMKKEYNL